MGNDDLSSWQRCVDHGVVVTLLTGDVVVVVADDHVFVFPHQAGRRLAELADGGETQIGVVMQAMGLSRTEALSLRGLLNTPAAAAWLEHEQGSAS